eukprot:SAG11_NODE_1017_length_6163_cov_6.440303_5_plen_283_part_00
MERSLLVIPPFRFATVEVEAGAGQQSYGLYRSAYPSLKNIRFLLRLKLTTIVSLLPAEPVRDLTEFCETNGIRNIHFRIDRFTDEVTFTPSVMTQILEILINADNYPLLLHCIDGANNTGLVIMCLRKLQNWAPAPGLAEFARFVPGEVSSAHARQFLNGYHGDIALPSKIPPWLWGGARCSRHPSLTIRQAAGAQSSAVLESGDRGAHGGSYRELEQHKGRAQATATFLHFAQERLGLGSAIRAGGQADDGTPNEVEHASLETLSFTISALALEGRSGTIL